MERRPVRAPDLQQAQETCPRATLMIAEGMQSYHGVPLIAKGQVKGVLELFHHAPLPDDQEWLNFLDVLAGQAAIAIDNAELFDHLQRANNEMMLAYDATIEGWARALELRDAETEGHTRRVTEMTVKLTRRMGFSDRELVHIRRGAILHDIGKMAIPDNILLKPGPLTDEEWVIMRQHTIYAHRMLSPIAFLRPAMDIPYYHHEKWDGSGYPVGLAGEAIPLAARIFAIVDVWDALSFDRPYRKACSRDYVLSYVREQSGTHFDPHVVQVFLDMMREEHGA
jgi:putative nucleotidyltransferase with HDIG domain